MHPSQMQSVLVPDMPFHPEELHENWVAQDRLRLGGPSAHQEAAVRILRGVYMAIACTVVPFGLQTWAMARMSATHAAIVFALEPVFATIMAIG